MGLSKVGGAKVVLVASLGSAYLHHFTLVLVELQ